MPGRQKASASEAPPRRRGAARPKLAQAQTSHAQAFRIVGIGASAGGLEACSSFLDAMPGDSGMAFILVQHLDPTHQSMMVDLL